MPGDKSKIRKSVLHNRRLLSEEVFAERNQALLLRTEQFIRDSQATTVHCFLPIGRNREPDTWPLLSSLTQLGLDVVISATDFETETMTHFLYEKNLAFENDRFGIPTPVNGTSANIQSIDLVLIPMLAADKYGNRIGYGKGYYDRLLPQMKPNVIKTGLSLGPLFDHFSFAETHDIRLDNCITPFQVIHF